MWSNKWPLGRQSWWTWPHLCSSFLEKRWNIRDCSFWSWYCEGDFWSRYSISILCKVVARMGGKDGLLLSEEQLWAAFRDAQKCFQVIICQSKTFLGWILFVYLISNFETWLFRKHLKQLDWRRIQMIQARLQLWWSRKIWKYWRTCGLILKIWQVDKEKIYYFV